jgi:hypothetical protein
MPQAFAIAQPGDGPDISRWPLLIWTEATGVATEDKQIPVTEIARIAIGRLPVEVAAELGTTYRHINEALDYVRITSRQHA